MNNSEKLYLQWNDFKQNISSSFGELREDKDLTDVTLACEDGKQVEAHKVVLAASSPFFKDILKRNKHPYPLIYMRGLTYRWGKFDSPSDKTRKGGVKSSMSLLLLLTTDHLFQSLNQLEWNCWLLFWSESRLLVSRWASVNIEVTYLVLSCQVNLPALSLHLGKHYPF